MGVAGFFCQTAVRWPRCHIMTDNFIEKTFGEESAIPKLEDNYMERDPIKVIFLFSFL